MATGTDGPGLRRGPARHPEPPRERTAPSRYQVLPGADAVRMPERPWNPERIRPRTGTDPPLSGRLERRGFVIAASAAAAAAASAGAGAPGPVLGGSRGRDAVASRA
ncbi:hypothetical protein [Streptomyces sp. NPDC008137]|uniref:hypothetical protein n=1 Tax=Streptomyces sp. NPDC008137 TaxID=3364813 RepID=UPI0036E53E2C